MKRLEPLPHEEFQPFTLNGIQFRYPVRYCYECPFHLKFHPMETYSEGMCMLRNVKKYRGCKVPQACLQWQNQCGSTGGNFTAVEKDNQ